MTNITDKIETFFDEKDLDDVNFTIKDKSGTEHFGNTEFVKEMILNTSENEQNAIYDMFVKIDFNNGDINDYLKHLFEGYIKANY